MRAKEKDFLLQSKKGSFRKKAIQKVTQPTSTQTASAHEHVWESVNTIP